MAAKDFLIEKDKPQIFCCMPVDRSQMLTAFPPGSKEYFTVKNYIPFPGSVAEHFCECCGAEVWLGREQQNLKELHPDVNFHIICVVCGGMMAIDAIRKGETTKEKLLENFHTLRDGSEPSLN